LGVFAVAVSFSHTMDFVRQHGQTEQWIVVGTACTVVLLTLQSGLETYRDSRAGRGRGVPAYLLALGVGVELYANASTAPGDWLARGVAAWPVPVAAAALYLWTRRLQHSAEAAEQTLLLVDVEHQDVEPVAPPAVEDDQEHEDEQRKFEEDEHDRTNDEDQEEGTAKERVLRLLDVVRDVEDAPGPTELALQAGCSKQYAAEVVKGWKKEREAAATAGQTALDWERIPAGASA
ncbi:hypothetical protein, partial [Streptomyces sp. NPDC056140]